MERTLRETIDEMLASVQEQLDDDELEFKLRTSRQLIVLLEERRKAGEKALEAAELDDETYENLQQLGYLE